MLGEAVLGGRDGGGVEVGTDGIEAGCGTDGGSTAGSAEEAGADSSCNTLNRFPVGT